MEVVLRGVEMSCVLVNSTGETFTPTKSGAICTWTWEMCQAARKEGFEPLVISRTSDAKPYTWGRTIFLKYPWIPAFRGTGIGRLIKIQQRLTGWGHPRQGGYAGKVVRAIRNARLGDLPIVLQNDPELAVYLRFAFPQARILHHFHNSNECDERFREGFSTAAIIATAVSQYCADWNQRYFNTDVQVLYNGVDTSRFVPIGSPSRATPVINFVGRIDKQKAPDLLLRAALLLTERTKSFRLQILGSRFYGYTEPDSYQSEIQRLSQDLESCGIEVRRPGFINRDLLPEELRKAQIHVVPSRWDEPFGLVTLEGMACGLATVGSRTGGTPEVIGHAGILFEKDSVEELAEQLHRLVVDDRLRTDMGHIARKRAEEFSWDRAWKSLRELLKLPKQSRNGGPAIGNKS